MTGDELKKLTDRVLSPVGVLAHTATPVERITAIASYRDACDRAQHLQDDSLTQALDRAAMSGDTLMARACATVAFERRHVDTVNRYLEHYPELDQAANELWASTASPPAAAEQVRRDLEAGLVGDNKTDSRKVAELLQAEFTPQPGALNADPNV